jgi:hypothetical protein
LPLQQPLGQLAALHTHAPPTHACPAPHGAPVPQAHAPAAQRSAFVGSQAPHAPPAGPHAEVPVVATHVLPWQHPAHVAAQPAQLPPTQASPAAQAWHAPPLVPQAALLGVVQVPLASQQPVGHEVASQTHAPPTQRLPAAHGALVPHRQAPPTQASALVASQAAHAAPAAPHADAVRGTQVSPLQQPSGHEVALHTHAPPTQACPTAHASLEPHAHAPPRHASLRVASQARQVFPEEPHDVTELVRQVAPSQQPLGHEVASHTQEPPRQRWPAPHAALAPQVHAPAVQVSATLGSHTVHDEPLVPHAVSEATVQTPPRQQPVGHVVAEQLAPASASPASAAPSTAASSAPSASASVAIESEEAPSPASPASPASPVSALPSSAPSSPLAPSPSAPSAPSATSATSAEAPSSPATSPPLPVSSPVSPLGFTTAESEPPQPDESSARQSAQRAATRI